MELFNLNNEGNFFFIWSRRISKIVVMLIHVRNLPVKIYPPQNNKKSFPSQVGFLYKSLLYMVAACESCLYA